MFAAMAARPVVDVVVPFAGSATALGEVVRRMERLSVADSDSITVVDNSAGGVAVPPHPHIRVLRAPELQSSYFARNRGAAGGGGEWIVFLDGDVEPPADLIDRYFARPPDADTAVLAGAVVEIPVDGSKSLAARYTAATQLINPLHQTLTGDRFEYAVTANCAIRRSAFEAVGGFTETIRSGGDADICFRLKEAGWKLEARPEAQVVHRGRTTLRALVRQLVKHGAGIAWLDRAYPGFAQHRSARGLVVLSLQSVAPAARAVAGRDRDRLALALLTPVHRWATWAGRRISNDIAPAKRR